MTVIAIDGPAGAGKSTVAKAVAKALGFTYLDSGAMYRSVALAASRRGADPATVAPVIQIEPRERVLLDGEDVTSEIRTREVAEGASRAAADPVVRQAMLVQQRRLIERGDWVAEGRDIGTVVAPQADLKLFITAAPEERARRRAQELGADPAIVLAEQIVRDQRDQARAHSPMRPAADAVILDTTGMTVEQVVRHVVELVNGLDARR